MDLDPAKVIAALGGPARLDRMDSEAEAEALEEHLTGLMDATMARRLGVPSHTPTVAQIEAEIESRPYRKGVGTLFAVGAQTPFGNRIEGEPDHVLRLPPLPARPTLIDFFRLRFAPATPVLQSADKALASGQPEEVVLACLLHDTAHVLMKADHGWWAAQLYEPYVSERVSFAIRYHQALRFFPDLTVGYEYPILYNKIFGSDYEPPAYIRAAHDYARNHRFYMDARMVTVNDLYSFDPHHQVDVEKFTDIIGRHFRQPVEGLGFDGSPVAHMWRTIIHPDAGP